MNSDSEYLSPLSHHEEIEATQDQSSEKPTSAIPSKSSLPPGGTEFDKIFARYNESVLDPLIKLFKISLLATPDTEQAHRDIFPDTAPAPCRAAQIERKARHLCRSSHLELRDRARASRKPETSLCCFGYFLFAVPVSYTSDCYGFIEGGRVFNGNGGDVRSIEPLLRLLRKNRISFDTTFLRESFLATPIIARQEMSVILGLIKGIAESLAAELAATKRQRGSVTHPAVIKAMNYTRSHLGESLAVPLVARAAGVSEDYFAKLFKRSTGQSYSDYVIEQRIKYAKELLVTTGQNVNEIAFAAGFESISHFNRCFKRQTETSPKLYRELQTPNIGRSIPRLDPEGLHEDEDKPRHP